MTRLSLALLAGAILSAAGSASAQQPVSEIVEGPGIKVGEGTVLHPVLGIETGIIHNVFYEEGGPGAEPNTAAVVRVLGSLVLGSLPEERLQLVQEQTPSSFGDLAFRADIHAEYQEYITGNDNVRAQRDIALGALLRGIVFPRRTWQFGFSDDFRRETRPTNFESTGDVDRDINRLTLEVRFKPEGRNISAGLRYENLIDYFENDSQQFANRMGHTVGLGAAWRWLPITRVYGDVSLGFFGGLGSASTRPSSMPLRIVAGIQSAITVKTTVNAKIGFAKGFYDTGPDFTNVTGGLQFGYRFSPQGALAALYEYDFNDSINANFYRDHAIKLGITQQLDRFSLQAAVELRFRLYRGVVVMPAPGSGTDRSDIILSVPLSASYNFRNWLAATLDYRFVTVQTDFRYIPPMATSPDDPSYTWHSLMAGVRGAL